MKYVQLQADRGKLPDGKQLVSAENLVMREKSQVMLGEDSWYGMGVIVDKTYGVPEVSHGGDLGGFHSDWYLLPDSGIAAVILTNSDSGIAAWTATNEMLEVKPTGSRRRRSRGEATRRGSTRRNWLKALERSWRLAAPDQAVGAGEEICQ